LAPRRAEDVNSSVELVSSGAIPFALPVKEPLPDNEHNHPNVGSWIRTRARSWGPVE